MKPTTTVKALLAVVFWGASFVATKVALAEVSPVAVVVLRFAIGLAVIFAVLARRHQLAPPTRQDVPWLALLGAIGITVHQMLQANGLVTTTATNSGWLVALIPIFTAVMARIVVREPFGAVKVAGLALAAAGALLVIGRGSLSAQLLTNATPGDALMLISAVNWALFTALSKRMIGRYESASARSRSCKLRRDRAVAPRASTGAKAGAGLLIAHIMAFGWLFTLPLLALGTNAARIAPVTAAGWLSVAFLGLFCSGLAYVFWYDALAETEAAAVTSFIYIEPIVTVVLAAALIGERITWPVIAGGVTILCGVWMVNRGASVLPQDPS